MNNEQLIIRCQQGDLAAFEQLFSDYAQKARQTAYLISRRKDLADDIAQEAFLQCFRQIKSLKQPDKFHSWFYQILMRICIRMVRKEKWKTFFSYNVDSEPDDNGNVSDKAETKELYRQLYDAVGKLKKSLQTVVVLYYFNELSVKEIAIVLETKEGTIKSRLHTARLKIADSMQNCGFSPYRDDQEKEGKNLVGKIAERHSK